MKKLCMLALLVALSASPALGQCALCYTAAAGAGKDGQRALSRAVIVLLVPPVGLMAVLIGVAFRYRSHNDDATGPIDDPTHMSW
jgi:hypothetical protein